MKLASYIPITNIVKPLNSGHIGGWTLVRQRSSLSQRLTSWPHPQFKFVNRFNTEGCGLQEAESANLDQTHSEQAKIDKTKEWTDYLSDKYPKFDLIHAFV